MTNAQTIKNLRKEIDTFVEERDWNKFHSPKNLAMALSVEVAELVEIFQWLNEDQSSLQERSKRSHLEEEIGDVMIYLTTLAAKFDIDPVEAAVKKMIINRKKYPVDIVKGKADKYDTYQL